MDAAIASVVALPLPAYLNWVGEHGWVLFWGFLALAAPLTMIAYMFRAGKHRASDHGEADYEFHIAPGYDRMTLGNTRGLPVEVRNVPVPTSRWPTGAVGVEASPGSFAEHMSAGFDGAHAVRFVVNGSGGTQLILLKRRLAGSPTVLVDGWLNVVSGKAKPSKTKDDEWTIYVEPVELGDGWLVFDVPIGRMFAATFGKKTDELVRVAGFRLRDTTTIYKVCAYRDARSRTRS